jgi:hypothetical protein
LGEKWPVNFACDSDFHVNRTDHLYAANLRHGTDGFTSPPKEGMLWISSPEKSDGFGRVRTRDLTGGRAVVLPLARKHVGYVRVPLPPSTAVRPPTAHKIKRVAFEKTYVGSLP